MWTHEQRLRHIGICFEGVALKWHCSLLARVPPPNTYDNLRMELLCAFKLVNYEDHLEIKLRKTTQGIDEPFADYFHDVLKLCARIDPRMSEKAKIQHLYRGLRPDVVSGIYRFLTPDSTTDDFFREARVYLEGEDKANRRRSVMEEKSTAQQPVLKIQPLEPCAWPSQMKDNFTTIKEFEQFEKSLMENLRNTSREL